VKAVGDGHNDESRDTTLEHTQGSIEGEGGTPPQLLEHNEDTISPLTNPNSFTGTHLSLPTTDSTTSSSSDDVTIPATVQCLLLPGVKLPRRKERWEEANIHFKITLPINPSEKIIDIDKYTENFQKEIYNYFTETEGNIMQKDKTDPFIVKYKQFTIKQLKRELAKLKTNHMNGAEILYVSRLIRQQINPKRSNQAKASIESQLHKNFWSTCRTIFNQTKNTLPTFGVEKDFAYFKQSLAQVRKLKVFRLPSWMTSLPPPLQACNNDPPTYQEVARSVRESKSKASACPLDEISVIALKNCPQLKTVLHKLLVACWENKVIPRCWKQSITVLIYKKGDTSEPENFRPITLQPVLYKIYPAIMRDKMYRFMLANGYIDTTIQKGFWPGADGVTEHNQLLTHIIKDVKRHQRTLIVTLIDLRNAFG